MQISGSTRDASRFLPAFLLALAACGDSTAPVVVASVTITPSTPAVVVNESVQLTATARDGSGNVLTGRPFTWSSGNDAVATVSGSGLALGLTAGSVQITAAAEGISSSVSLTVTGPPGSVVVTSIEPALLIEGGSATITGAGFSASAPGNTVTIDGVAAPVTAASAVSLTITVPSSGCMPARSNAVVRVAVGAESAERAHPVRPAAFTDLPVGELTLLADAQNFCLQFDAAPASTSYLLGVQSVSETPGSRTPVTVRGRAAGAGGAPLVQPGWSAPSGIPVVDAADHGRAERRDRHHAAELALREQESKLAPRLFAAARRAGTMPGGGRLATSAAVPVDAEVGDSVDVRVPNTNALCDSFTTVRAIVLHRGTRGIWVEDITNPAGGFSAADYASLGGMLDNEIWTSNTNYFGIPTDLDANQRIVIVVTKLVNARENILGFVSSADFFPDDCASANGGEYYYSIAPDAAGTAGAVYTVEEALLDAPKLIAHEFTHIIQLGRRLFTPGATSFASVWELEGQATFAEEINGHAFTGNSIGQNYGFAVAFNNPATAPIPWYISGFSDLAFYYGYQSPTSNVGNAPEQCGWLGRSSPADALGPCLGDRRPYGVSWSFLRWLSDQYGPDFPGGEAELHRRLVVDVGAGFATITRVIGRPIDELLAHWAAALHADDRYAGLDERLGFTSWNFTGVFNGLVEPARLAPRNRAFASFTDNVTVIAGSSAYYVVSGASRPASSLSFLSQTGTPLPAGMRIWIVRTQ